MLLVGLLATSCGTSETSSPPATSIATPELPLVVTTTDIWADVVEKATCGQVEVENIIPSGSDPHNYSPSVRDIIALENAELVVENGLGLEELLSDTLASASNKLVVADLINSEDDHDDDLHGEDDHDEDLHDEDDHDDDLHGDDDHDEDDHHPEGTALPAEGHDHEDGSEDHHEDDLHDHSGDDPHIWFDFNIVRSLVSNLETHLAEVATNTDELEDCADDYIAQLHETEDIVAATLASVPEDRRLLVTQHDTLQRLAESHGYQIIGSVIPSTSTLAEADLRHLIELEEQVNSTGAAAIFVDASGVNSDIETFANRIGLPLVVLYTESLGAPDTGADTYTGMMLTNADRIADALASS